ncbi:hypothetical protein [Butyrivibrio sp. MC2013]|uniref:hypothetical protein n=1 Tax=Butyrivibrio sp. MC2013 TaxID=1280686 RepID=UPI000411170E|nr:hypothetical protein [Butyrivibrio sp. MC2013]
MIIYGFDGKQYYISEDKDVNAIIDTLNDCSYRKMPEEEYVEGLYLMDFVYENITVSVGVDNTHLAYNGDQYSVSDDSLDEVVAIIQKYLE